MFLFVAARADGSAFLGAIAGFAALLLVFLLYLNKRWWWGAVSGLTCCDEPCPSPPIRPPTPSTNTTATTAGITQTSTLQTAGIAAEGCSTAFSFQENVISATCRPVISSKNRLGKGFRFPL